MRRPVKRLTLRREAVRLLTAAGLDLARGGDLPRTYSQVAGQCDDPTEIPYCASSPRHCGAGSGGC